jgi:hypothetical protein
MGVELSEAAAVELLSNCCFPEEEEWKGNGRKMESGRQVS